MAVPAQQRQHRQISVALDAECEEILDAVTAAIGQGSRSKAVRFLIRTHAGRALEQAEQEDAPEPEQVDGWRKRRLSRELIGEIAARIRAGATRADAYRLSGVTQTQAASWLATGRTDVRAGKQSVHADLVMYLEKVEAEVRLERARSVKDAKWHLERDTSGQYAKVTRTDATVTHNYTLVLDWDVYTLAEARTLVALLRKGSPDPEDPALQSRWSRPALEGVPPDLADSIEGEAVELEDEDESPSARSPVTSTHESPSASAKAPSLDEEQRDAIHRSPVISESGRRAAEPDVNSDRLMLDPGPPITHTSPIGPTSEDLNEHQQHAEDQQAD